MHVIRCSINLQVCCCGCPHKEVYEQHLQGKKHLRVSTCIYHTHDRQTIAGLKLTFAYFPQNVSLSGRSMGGKWKNNVITMDQASRDKLSFMTVQLLGTTVTCC